MIKVEVVEGEPGGPPEASTTTDDAWKVLSLTNEWVRHADAKTGLTLAFVGATAALLYSLVESHEPWSRLLTVTVVLASVALVASVGFAAAVLFARTKRRGQGGTPDVVADEDTVNLLFFGDVHRRYALDRPTYRQVLSLLTGDPERLVDQIADQVHANACIAAIKFRWTNRAIVAEIFAAFATGVTALLTATGW